MEILLLFPVIIALIVISSLIAHFFPLIPVSLLQVVFGVGLSYSIHGDLTLDTEWFLLLFIAPMLFYDSWRFPNRELWQLRFPIIGNAFLLVFLTAIGGGWLIHLLIPDFPLSISIALAAALSPTDPVAVGAILSRISIPQNLLHVLMGESLLNDASGLVAFRYAVSATMVGAFVLHDAVINFFYVTIVGALTGFVLSFLLDWIQEFIRRRGASDEILQVIINVLSPFLIFYVVEDIEHSSGVVAVVVAGIFSKLRNNNNHRMNFEYNVLATTVWRALTFILNGTIFILLGMQLPHAYREAVEAAHLDLFTGIGYGILVWFIIFLIRAVWTYANEYFSYKKKDSGRTMKPSLTGAIIMAFSGVRGAIALAAVLSIQTVSGRSFPRYSFIVFIAAVVVIFSLILAAIMLPLLANRTNGKLDLPKDVQLLDEETDFTENEEARNLKRKPNYLDENSARIFQLQSGIQELKLHLHDADFTEKSFDGSQSAARDLIFQRQQQINDLQLAGGSKEAAELARREEEFYTVALKAEKSAVEKMYRQHKMSDPVYRANMRGINWSFRDVGHHRSLSFQSFLRIIRHGLLYIELKFSRIDDKQAKKERFLVHRVRAKSAIKGLTNYLDDIDLNSLDRIAAYNVIVNYRSWLAKIKAGKNFNKNYNSSKISLSLAALTAEREAVRRLISEKKISDQTGIKLLQDINYAETSVLTVGDDR